ncbi:MAG: hypothetical protein D6778_03755 [Nitrospirae bacterium]|nr:MAG: hypothetical protein D6778_03755 [Nitrospirota bacterium]
MENFLKKPEFFSSDKANVSRDFILNVLYQINIFSEIVRHTCKTLYHRPESTPVIFDNHLHRPVNYNIMKLLKGFSLLFIATLLTTCLMTSDLMALCVKVPVANLRAGPGTNYKKTWQVYKYMPLRRIGKKGDWYKVKDVDGDIHWVFKNLVTSRYKCAVVKKDEANIRTGPGTHYKQTELSPALRYDTFRVLRIKGKWVKVRDEFGEEGWIYRPLLWIQ